ncbi:MAG TPA: 50S ribosomal protein L32 [Mesotoga sp.]|nr:MULTISPECIES: 50S ribosomal protein L32 [unclassified Mesotoga]HNS35854.1 50S ribosomal protein L32 [Mesotoga sp.]
MAQGYFRPEREIEELDIGGIRVAVPKQKRSRSRTRLKRAKTYSAIKVAVSTCPNCGEPKQPHRVCLHCGYYGGRQILEIGE